VPGHHVEPELVIEGRSSREVGHVLADRGGEEAEQGLSAKGTDGNVAWDEPGERAKRVARVRESERESGRKSGRAHDGRGQHEPAGGRRHQDGRVLLDPVGGVGFGADDDGLPAGSQGRLCDDG